MSKSRQQDNYEITWLIRRLFRAMGAAADEYLQESGLSAAERAVMEFLYPTVKLSVPAIAARYNVSRQHVQVTVNALRKRGLLRAENNPQHKRSALIRLSSLGRDCFREIRKNEAAAIDRIFHDVSDKSLETTRATLQTLYQNIQ